MINITYNPTGAIENDQQAEDLILQLQELEEERERLKDVCRKQIELYQQKMEDIDLRFDKEKEYPLIMLGEYARAKANKVTKTKKSYALPSGTLVWKKHNPEFKRDEKVLLAWAEQNANKFVRTVTSKKLDWAGMKDHVVFDLEQGMIGLVTEDGEYLEPDGLEVVEREDTFEIE